MDSIAQTYDGYDRSGSENEYWAYNPEEMAGKKAARNWIDTKVETDLEKILEENMNLQRQNALLLGLQDRDFYEGGGRAAAALRRWRRPLLPLLLRRCCRCARRRGARGGAVASQPSRR